MIGCSNPVVKDLFCFEGKMVISELSDGPGFVCVVCFCILISCLSYCLLICLSKISPLEASQIDSWPFEARRFCLCKRS